MHQRSDIFTVRNIFTLILLGVLIIGLYSYHNMNYRLSSSSSTLKSMKMQMESSDNQLRNAIKAKTACFKDVMQLRASIIDMKTKLSEAETELAKEKHDTAAKLMRCSEDSKDLKSQLEKMQTEVQTLKEEDRNKVQKKKDEEEEKEKKLKEMTAEHELKVSKLKDEIADLQKEKEAVQKKLEATLQIVSKYEKTDGKGSKELTTKKVEEDNSMRQMRPPVVKNPDRKVHPHANNTQASTLGGVGASARQGIKLTETQRPLEPKVTTGNNTAAPAKKRDRSKHAPTLPKETAVVNMEQSKKAGGKKLDAGDAKRANDEKGEGKKEQPEALRKPQAGPGVDEEDKDSDKGGLVKEEKRGQQLDMPLPRDAAKQNKEPNQLPHPGGAESDGKLSAGRARQIQPANDDDDTGGGVPIY